MRILSGHGSPSKRDGRAHSCADIGGDGVNSVCEASGFYPEPSWRTPDKLSAVCPHCGAVVRLSKSGHLLAHQALTVESTP